MITENRIINILKECSYNTEEKSENKLIVDQDNFTLIARKIFAAIEQSKEVTLEIENKRFLTVGEARAVIGCSRQFLYKLISRKEINLYKIGGRTYFSKDELYNLFTKS